LKRAGILRHHRVLVGFPVFYLFFDGFPDFLFDLLPSFGSLELFHQFGLYHFMHFFFVSLKKGVVIHIHRLASDARVDFKFFIARCVIWVLNATLEGTVSCGFKGVYPLLAFLFMLTFKPINFLSGNNMELFGVAIAKVNRSRLFKIYAVVGFT